MPESFAAVSWLLRGRVVDGVLSFRFSGACWFDCRRRRLLGRNACNSAMSWRISRISTSIFSSSCWSDRIVAIVVKLFVDDGGFGDAFDCAFDGGFAELDSLRRIGGRSFVVVGWLSPEIGLDWRRPNWRMMCRRANSYGSTSGKSRTSELSMANCAGDWVDATSAYLMWLSVIFRSSNQWSISMSHWLGFCWSSCGICRWFESVGMGFLSAPSLPESQTVPLVSDASFRWRFVVILDERYDCDKKKFLIRWVAFSANDFAILSVFDWFENFSDLKKDDFFGVSGGNSNAQNLSGWFVRLMFSLSHVFGSRRGHQLWDSCFVESIAVDSEGLRCPHHQRIRSKINVHREKKLCFNFVYFRFDFEMTK